MFHTLTSLPEDWLCDAEGMLQPHSYVDWKSVEALFRTPRAFIAFMSQKKDIESAIDRECTSLSAMHKASETELRRGSEDDLQCPMECASRLKSQCGTKSRCRPETMGGQANLLIVSSEPCHYA